MTFLLVLSAPLYLFAQPANDLCMDAIDIGSPPAGMALTGTGSTLTATTTDYPLSCGAGVDNSSVGGVWYTFDAISNTPYTITTCDSGTNFDTEISVHTITGTGSCMTELMCDFGNDDAACTFGATLSSISFTSPTEFTGTTYYVYVKGNGAATGNFELAVINNTPLPVDLITFTGTNEAGTNKLYWETASEFNTESHIIERSMNGTTHWEAVGKVEAVGFTSERQKYELKDVNSPSKCYYRLLSIDFDGHRDYSKVLYLEQAQRSFEIINVIPNPAQDYVIINYVQETNQPLFCSLSNAQGKEIQTWKTNKLQGEHQEKINLSDCPVGIYFIRMRNETEVVTRRILRM